MNLKHLLIQNKTVAIYSSNSNHYSLIHIIVRSLQIFQCKILLFIPKEMENQVDRLEVEVINKIDSKQFISKKIFNQLNDADFIIVDQLYSLRELVSFRLHKIKRPNLLIVHDCNSWFSPKTPKRFINKIKNYLTSFVKNQFHYFAVAGVNMQDYLQNELGIYNSIVIPFRYADFNVKLDVKEKKYQPGTPLVLTVPGMITHRRNYKELLDIITTETLRAKVELVLLGKPKGDYGLQIIESVKSKIKEGYIIQYWNKFIPSEVFNNQIHRADLLFSEFDPVYYTDNGQEEIYGITKETGISLLMLNKAKIGLLPRRFKQMKSIENQTLFYNSLNDLTEILVHIYTGKINLDDLSQKAYQNASSMDINTVSEAIAEAYSKQIKNHV